MLRRPILHLAPCVFALLTASCDDANDPLQTHADGPAGKADGHECDDDDACVIDAYELQAGKAVGDHPTLSEVHLAADPDTGSVFAFGFPYLAGDYPATVWERDEDGAWALVDQDLEGGPPQRLQYATAWDESRGVMVLFGGQVPGPGLDTWGAAVYDDVWEWSPAGGWTQVETTGSGPVGRAFHEMAYDGRTGHVLLFGGGGVASWDDRNLDDLWSWDGSGWTLLDDGGGPGARRGAAMAYDPHEERMLVYGGGPGSSFDRSSDLWAWDESGWVLLEAEGPTADRWPVIVYDPRQHAPVLFRPRDGYMGEIWAWRDGVWEELETKGIRERGSGPSASEALIDPVTAHVVLLDRRSAWSARPASGNLAPRVEIPDRVVATPTHDLLYGLWIFDPEGEDVEVEITGLPGTALYNHHIDKLVWLSPPLDLVGEYEVTINASDGEQTTTRTFVLALEARSYDFLPVGPIDRLVSLSSMRISRSLGAVTKGGSATGSCRLQGVNPGIVDISCGISSPALGQSGSMVTDRQVGFGGSTALGSSGSFAIFDSYNRSNGVPVYSASINGHISETGQLWVTFDWNGYVPSTSSRAQEAGIGQL